MTVDVFRKQVLEKYPDAIINVTQQNQAVAYKRSESAVYLIGCTFCFSENSVQVKNNSVFVNGVQAIPISAIAEDDSFNPLMPNLFLCPQCSRMIVHPELAKMPVLGRVVEEWKD